MWQSLGRVEVGIPHGDDVYGIRNVVFRRPWLGRPARRHSPLLAGAQSGDGYARRGVLSGGRCGQAGRRRTRQLRPVRRRGVLTMRRVILHGRLIAAIGLLPVLVGCYTYTPIATLQPAPGTNLSLVLSDEGRMQSMRQVGPYAMRIEGELLQATPSDLVLAVSDVVDIRGTHSKWTGESVTLPRSYVTMTYQKQFSRSRTVLLATAVAGGIVAIIASRSLLGFGGSGGTGQAPPG